jgi:putative flavoprotein involved in K+ transport
MSHRTDAVVVGAGFAGLAASAALAQRGVDHVVLERDRVGETWRSQRWDSFRLNSVRHMSGLRGDGFAPASELIAELERRASALPVREGVAVRRVWRRRGGGHLVVTSEGVIETPVVIAASGGHRVPRLPGVASSVSGRGIEHLHTADYRNAAALVDGAVLVVGSGQSGVQIADDLLRSGRRVYLATSRVGRMPRRHRGRDTQEWLADMGFFDAPRPAEGRERPPQVGGGHSISLQSLARGGAVLLGRLLGADGTRLRLGDELGEHVRYADGFAEMLRSRIDAWIAGRGVDAAPAEPDPTDAPLGPMSWPRSLDLRAEGITTVIWATGFGGDFGWLTMPILRPDGRPFQRHGVTPAEGIYTVGVPWQSRRGSAVLLGIERDAGDIADRLSRPALPNVRQTPA